MFADESYLDSYISTIENPRSRTRWKNIKLQIVKSGSERSPIVTTEEHIGDSGVGKSCLLLRFAVQTVAGPPPLPFHAET
ncbi:hypothetical protein Bca4012_025115 [Brassica carinata]